MKHLKAYFRVLEKTLFVDSSRPLMFATGLTAVFWGIQVLRPGVAFAGPSFAYLEVWPESAWATVLLTVGVLNLLALGSQWPLKAFVSLLGFIAWLALASGFYLANHNGTAVPVYGALALLAFGNFYRAVQGKNYEGR